MSLIISDNMKKRGLFIGRFNPPHLGHFKALEEILRENAVDEVIIGIGSAQESYTQMNPFTAGERFEMILAGLKELNLFNENILVVPLLDINNNNQWVSYILSILPHFEFVYSNNPLVKLLIDKNPQLEILDIKLIKRNEFSSTNIRKKIIIEDESWKELVPKSIVNVIIDLQGINRIKTLSTNDLA